MIASPRPYPYRACEVPVGVVRRLTVEIGVVDFNQMSCRFAAANRFGTLATNPPGHFWR